MSILSQHWDVAEYFFNDEASEHFDLIFEAIDHVYNTEEDYDIRVALTKYATGNIPNHSSGICETHTAGYGKLDENGYWEFPLPANFVERFLSFKRAK